MSSNRSVVTEEKGKAGVATVPIPELRDDYIIVKVKAVALNPTDWKHVDYYTRAGTHIGCDYAGVVEEVGSKVTKGFKKGDRVAGLAHGGNEVHPEDGAFAEYITAKGDLQIKIPDNLSFEEAATLGVGVTTVGQALYQSLGLPLPDKAAAGEKRSILIYGGSTATGSLSIQYAKLSGLTVITTASPHNFDYVKSLGADAVFDYNSPTCAADIKALTEDKLDLALDCIAKGGGTEISVGALSSSGGVYSTIVNAEPSLVASINPNVQVKHTIGYTMIGERFTIGELEFPAKPEDFEFGKQFWELSRGLLGKGAVKVHRPSVNKYGQGFEGILKGLEAMRDGKVHGEKLVFTL